MQKKKAAKSGRPFTEILSEGQQKNEYAKTPDVDKSFLDIQTTKFNMIQSFVKNKEQDLAKEADRIAQSELDYYLSSNKKAEYEALNSI